MSIKETMSKIEIPDNLIEEINRHRFIQLNMNFDHAKLAGKLPDIHKDPFDRMLIAQAIVEKLTLVTRDRLIARYDVNLLDA